MINAKQVQELRQKTGAGVIDCKEALTSSNGNEQQAIEYLRAKGIGQREKRATKTASEGMLYSYVHAGNKISVMLEVNCESDFVSRSEEFREFVKNLALHIVASKPLCVNVEDVGASVLAKEKRIVNEQLKEMKGYLKKPKEVIEQIVNGKLEKFYADTVLMRQSYVKNPEISIEQLLNDLVLKVKENVVIKRFIIWQLGE